MILIDTSVWVDYLRAGDKLLVRLLDAREVLAHPFVIGELALGNLRQRQFILQALNDLPQANVASDREVLHLTEHESLFGLGIGYVDAHLLAAVRLTADARLWTRDKQLHSVAGRMGLAPKLS